MERRQFDTPRRICIGNTAAHCEHCGCEEFFRLRLDERGEKTDMMACRECGHEHLYPRLLAQIADTVMRRSERALAHAEELRKRLRELGE